MTLYARIALLMLASVTVCVLAMSLVYYETRQREYKQQRLASAATLTAAVAKSVFHDTLEGRRLQVRNTLRAIARGNEEISYILIIDFNGEPFASTFPDEAPQELLTSHEHNGATTGTRNLYLDGVEITDFAFPLFENLDAHIHIGYNTTRLDRSLRETRFKTFLITLTAIAAGLLAAALAAGRVSRPLRKLAAAVDEYGHGKPFTLAGDGKSGPEVNLLINSFAAMIEQRKAAEDRIFRLAYQDALTGLPNRLSLQERMDTLLALARREGVRVALMLIDLDRFKLINDTFGHHTGDELLQQVGKRLVSTVRDSDLVARLGGDEFVVVLNGVEEGDASEKLAKKLVALLSEPYLISGHQLISGPSIGICYYPDDGQTLEELLKHADIAMYQAKAHGRGCYCRYRQEMQIADTWHTVPDEADEHR